MRGSRNLWLLLLVLVCVLSFWIGHEQADDGAVRATAPPAPAVASPRPATFETVHLAVLNGTGESGLAREFSLLLARLGCVTSQVANAPHPGFDSTVLINRRLTRERARDLAAELGGMPVLHEFDGRQPEDAALVLGADATHLRDRLREMTGRLTADSRTAGK